MPTVTDRDACEIRLPPPSPYHFAPADRNTPDPGLAQEFSRFVADRGFPCVGAKSAFARDTIAFYTARDLTSAWDDLAVHDALLDWARKYRDEPGGLRSFIVLFDRPCDLGEAAFERFMWERIQSLVDKDAWRGQRLEPTVSADPQDPHFSLSIGGEAFFVVGMHPNASRKARRFAHPALVFNLHDQFDRLRREGEYQRMREVILKRDRDYSGSINPMLATHGEASEARQYSGRLVADDWACPFSDPRKDGRKDDR